MPGQRPLRLHWVKGVCVFRNNMPPALLAAWPWSFTCHCGNTGMELTPNKNQYTKLTEEKKILPPHLPGFELATFRSPVWRSNQQAIPAPCILTSCQTLRPRQRTRCMTYDGDNFYVISWGFGPCQPQRNHQVWKQTSIYLLVSHSTSHCTKILFFLKPQLKSYTQCKNTNPGKQWHIFWSLFIFRRHSTREPASIVRNDEQGGLFFGRAHTGTDVSHGQHRKSLADVLKKCRWMDREGRN